MTFKNTLGKFRARSLKKHANARARYSLYAPDYFINPRPDLPS